MILSHEDFNVLHEMLRDTEMKIFDKLGLDVRVKVDRRELEVVSIKDYAVAIAKGMGTTLTDLRHRSKRDFFTLRRSVVCLLVLQQFPDTSLKELGKLMKRDHSTVLYSRNKANDLLDTKDEEFVELYHRAKKAEREWLESK